MNNIGKFAAYACFLLASGCASGQINDTGSAASSSEKILRENETRLNNLENSVSALNTQIAQLNNRIYEVRTKTGQRTSMTVVPVNQGAPGASSAAPPIPVPVQPVAAQAPAGRKINPAAKPAALASGTAAKPAVKQAAKPAAPTPAAAAQRASQNQPAERTAGPSGQLAALPPEGDLAMPPENAAPEQVPVPTGNTYSGNTISAHAQNQISPTDQTVTPVPLIPANDLSLPPENTELNLPPESAAAAPVPVSAPVPAPAPRQTAQTAQKGEEAAYQAALKAARAGRTAEGIKMFRNFLQKYPNGKYTANADYWIGECLYAQGKYQDALSQFQNINSSFPRHHKNADALLKAGMSLTKIGDNSGAQQKYRQLLSEFPNSDAAKRVRAMGIR